MSKYLNRYVKTVLGAACLSCVLGVSAFASQVHVVDTEIKKEQLAKGLVYEYKSMLSDQGWLDVHTLVMDLDEPTLDLSVIRDEEVFGQSGRLKAMAEAQEITAGVNGSFFSMGASLGEVVGLEAEDGQLSYAIDDYNYYSNNGASLYTTVDGSTMMDFLNISMTVETENNESIRIQGINTRSVGGEPVIFNRTAFETTETINALGDLYKIVVEDEVITEIIKDNTVVDIPEHGYVMVFPAESAPTYMSGLSEGNSLEFKQVSNFTTEDMEMMVTGGGFIIKDGVPVSEGMIVGEGQRHPRTAVGIDEDTNQLILMVVDGRGSSIGATHGELGEYLLEYGVDQAIHFDGGGSSEMVTQEAGDMALTIQNDPSDGRERGIVNGLGITNNAPLGDDYELILTVDQNRVFVDNTIGLTLKAVDTNYHAVEVDSSKIRWTMSGGYGDITENTFTPRMSGAITLTAEYNDKQQSVNIEVVDTLIDLEVYPKVVHLEDGVQTFTVVGTDEKGYKSVINNDLLTWELTGNVGSVKDGVFTNTGGEGQSRIDVKYGDIKEVAYAVSGEQEEVAVLMQNETVTSLVYPETVNGQSYINNNLLSIVYAFEPSEDNQAVYAVFENAMITKPVDGLTLNMGGYPSDVAIKAQFSDVYGEKYTVTFEQNENGMIKAGVPAMAYPIKMERLYVVTLPTETAILGQVDFISMSTVSKIDESDLEELISIAPNDILYNPLPSDGGFDIGIFGATAGRNRLLDEVVMDKVYEELNDMDFAVYAGRTDIEADKITNSYLAYENSFKTVDLNKARIISLAMGEGSLVKTDYTQWEQLNQSLKSTVQDAIVIVGTEKLINNTDQSFTKEGERLHEMISDFQRKSGKTIFYVNASGYTYELSYYEGIRYIDLNGLWYRVDEEHAVDLYDSFQMVQIHFDGSDVSYRVEDLYPKTTVTNAE